MKISVKIDSRDGWIGYYHDRSNHVVYVCPVPYLVFKFDLRRRCPHGCLSIDECHTCYAQNPDPEPFA